MGCRLGLHRVGHNWSGLAAAAAAAILTTGSLCFPHTHTKTLLTAPGKWVGIGRLESSATRVGELFFRVVVLRLVWRPADQHHWYYKCKFSSPWIRHYGHGAQHCVLTSPAESCEVPPRVRTAVSGDVLVDNRTPNSMLPMNQEICSHSLLWPSVSRPNLEPMWTAGTCLPSELPGESHLCSLFMLPRRAAEFVYLLSQGSITRIKMEECFSICPSNKS